jgi:hypothetical protein
VHIAAGASWMQQGHHFWAPFFNFDAKKKAAYQ